MLRSATSWVLLFALAVPGGLAAQERPERPDLAAIHQIKQEAFQNSQVMETLLHLTDHLGPRLAGSPEYKRAADWVVTRLKEFGIENGRLEKFEFGRGWRYTRFSAHMIEPGIQPLIGFPMAWTPGTSGTVTGEVVYVPMTQGIDFGKWRGKLKDKVVLIDAPRPFPLETTPQARRLTDKDLEDLEKAPDPTGRAGPGGPGGPGGGMAAARAFRDLRNKFLREEGVLLALTPGYRGTYGSIAAAGAASQDPKTEVPSPLVAIASEHYARMVRLVEKKIPVKVEANVQTEFFNDAPGYNVLAELAGTGRNKDEVVMIGAHLDSWHGATGATDNGASCAVMIEVMRLLKTTGVKLNRTVRMGLWGGEEQGLIGSRAYVKEHVADRETMKLGKEHAKISAYLNIDNGAGRLRGIYTQGNEMVRPVFQSMFVPFQDLGISYVTNRTTGSTDHVSFDAVGIPGFQFIQDPMDYGTRTHHSNMDTYDRVQPADLMQQAAVLASMVTHLANRDEMLPRKPLPKPQPAPQQKKAAPAAASSSAAGQP